ncbi:MAG TPA: hypothetical protein VEG44_03615 [Candidatus Acidoferrales bacterium]|nr:hypothetical protein [Candidatus Acidoferrales bacterium]
MTASPSQQQYRTLRKFSKTFAVPLKCCDIAHLQGMVPQLTAMVIIGGAALIITTTGAVEQELMINS